MLLDNLHNLCLPIFGVYTLRLPVCYYAAEFTELTELNNTGRQCAHHKLRQSPCAHHLVQTDNMWCIYLLPPSLLVLFNDRVIFKQYTPQKYSLG